MDIANLLFPEEGWYSRAKARFTGLGATPEALLGPREQNTAAYFTGPRDFVPMAEAQKRERAERGKRNAETALNFVGSIGGMNAARPPREALRFAEKLERQGARPETIWRGFGLMRDKAGNWMFEIPDEKMRLNVIEGARPEIGAQGAPAGFYTERPLSWPRPPVDPNTPKGWQSVDADARLYPHFPQGTRVGDVAEHPELFAQYPHLQNLLIDIPMDFTGSLRGAYLPDRKKVLMASGEASRVPQTFAHELGHAVQHFEEMPMGGNPGQFRPKDYAQLQNDKTGWEDIFSSYVKRYKIPQEHADTLKYLIDEKSVSKKTRQILDDYARLFPDVYDSARQAALRRAQLREIDNTAYNQYRSLHGEQVAEAIAKRLGLSNRERWTRPFWEDFSLPMQNQLLGDVIPWTP